MTFKDKVVNALCADRDFWFNEFDDVCDSYGIDPSEFYDENGHMIDREEVARFLVDNTDYLYDLADKYGIIDDDFYSEVAESVIRKIIKENFGKDGDDLSPFEEYEQGYPNGDFDVSDMTPEELAEWCQTDGDFLYVYEGLRGMRIMSANTHSIIYDIVNDLYNCDRIEPSHDVDYLFHSREKEFINNYVCIFKVIGTKDGDYYIVYEEEKNRREPMSLNESFKSNELRNWFKLHGGVKKIWDDYPEMNVVQDGLGDVNDEDITYLEEFDNIKNARSRIWHLKNETTYNGRRSERNIKNFYTMYKANDGFCLIVGLDRNKVETGINWGGEHTKKKSDRIWRDDKDPQSYRVGKYVDDRGKYYYSQKAQDFGLKTNKNFKDKMSDNNNIRNKMSDEEWKKYQDMRVNDIDSYLKKYYKKGLPKRNVIKESFAEQWEDEIKIFMKGLENGQALVDNGYVAVEWEHSDNDPRFIYYKEGEDRLTDDHFSQQHSRRLYWDEISNIRDCAKRIYGVDIYIPDDEYYDEVNDF